MLVFLLLAALVSAGGSETDLAARYFDARNALQAFPNVFGPDPRTDYAPTRGDTASRLIGELRRGNIVGTGFLVGPDLVMTVGHFPARGTNGRFLPMKFTLEPDGPSVAAASFTVTAVVFRPAPKPWTKEPYEDERENDWAILRLSSAPGRERGWFQLAAIGAEGFTDETLSLAGYSLDRAGRTIDRDCFLYGVDPGWGRPAVLRHDCATTRGASGAPLWLARTSGLRHPLCIGLNVAEKGGGNHEHTPTYTDALANLMVHASEILRALRAAGKLDLLNAAD